MPPSPERDPDAGKRAPLGVLQEVFGFDRFRGQQLAIIEHVIAGGDAVVLMPTGGGKSICYQIPALLRPGLGVVVSPLIALMQDLQRQQALAQKKDVISPSIDEFYYLSRIALVKDEANFDKFDRAFAEFWQGVETIPGIESQIPLEWLLKQVELTLTEEEKKQIAALGGARAGAQARRVVRMRPNSTRSAWENAPAATRKRRTS